MLGFLGHRVLTHESRGRHVVRTGRTRAAQVAQEPPDDCRVPRLAERRAAKDVGRTGLVVGRGGDPVGRSGGEGALDKMNDTRFPLYIAPPADAAAAAARHHPTPPAVVARRTSAQPTLAVKKNTHLLSSKSLDVGS